jgi:hypothetical protein
MSSFFPGSAGLPAVRYKAEWDEWTSQFADTLAGFGWLVHFVDLAYADLPSLPLGSSGEEIAAWNASNETRTFLRDSVKFSWPGMTGVYTLSPAACRALHANPPPVIPAHDWEPTASQTSAWAADLARGKVDVDSYRLQAAAKVFPLHSWLVSCSPRVFHALPSGSGW